MADNMNPMPPSESITDIRMKVVTDVDKLAAIPHQNAYDGGGTLDNPLRPGADKMGKI